jgi:carbamoyl-phosphate synthase large subunit
LVTETVSTDFDTAEIVLRTRFLEHIYDIIQHEKPGVIVQLGGQTALKLAEKLSKYG